MACAHKYKRQDVLALWYVAEPIYIHNLLGWKYVSTQMMSYIFPNAKKQ